MDRKNISDDLKDREYWNKIREAREKEKSVKMQQGGNYRRNQPRVNKKKFVGQSHFTYETVGRHLHVQNTYQGNDKKSRKEQRKSKRASFCAVTEDLPLTRRERESYLRVLTPGRHQPSNEDVNNYVENEDELDDRQYNEDVFYFRDNEGWYILPKEGKINDNHLDHVQRAENHGGYGGADITNVDADDYSQDVGGDDEMPEDEESCNLIEETHLLEAKSHGNSQQYGGAGDIQEKHHRNVSQENDNVNFIQYDDMVDISQEVDDVRVTQEDYNVSLSQQDDNASLSQQDDNVSLSQQDDNVSLSQQDDNVSLSQQYDNASLSQQYDNVSLSQQYDNVSLSQQDDNVSLSQQYDNVSLSQQYDNVSLSQEDDCHKVNQEDEAQNGIQAEDQSLFYGSYETQVSEGGEADVLKRLVSCEKNPGHTEFVPPGDFNITHLPLGYHDDDLVDQIKTTADLTVKVKVKMTSTERPEFWQNTQKPFPFHDTRGSDVTRTGTGIVHRVTRFNDVKEFQLGVCNCFRCQGRATPNLVRGYVWVNTGLQVVFDDVEARHTSCQLFYDRPDSPVVLLGGWKTVNTSAEEYRCRLIAVTCDIELLDTLEKMLEHRQDMDNKLKDKYKFLPTEDKWVFIVSHPHGGPKQVSIGRRTNTHTVKNDLLYKINKFIHTACTCPGSSGAYVLPLGYLGEFFHDCHVHSGVNSEGTNFSSAGWE